MHVRGANTLAFAASANRPTSLCPGLFRHTYFTPVCHVHKAERLGDARARKRPSIFWKKCLVFKVLYAFWVSENKEDQIKILTQKEHPLGLHNFPCHKTHKSQLKYETEHEISI